MDVNRRESARPERVVVLAHGETRDPGKEDEQPNDQVDQIAPTYGGSIQNPEANSR
jgi:hypothetical protein